MSTCTATPIVLRPAFDSARFATLSRTMPQEHAERETLAIVWDRWLEHLRAYRIVCDGDQCRSWLLLWLEPEAETDMERAWADSPLRGYLLDMLAVCLVMAAAAQVVPELEDQGCAPVPEPHPAIQRVAEKLGLGWTGPGTLDRRYAMVTPAPWAGGCETCCLCRDCPRLRGAATA